MMFYRAFVIGLVCIQISAVFGSLDFIDCGGDPVQSVSIVGCDETPCFIEMNSSYHILIRPKYISPRVDSISVQVGILQFGAYFAQTAVYRNPCVVGCPITYQLVEPEFDILFTVSPRMIPSFSFLQAVASYDGTTSNKGFCIILDVITSR